MSDLKAKELLKSLNLKATTIRISILQMLFSTKNLLSAQEIHTILLENGIDANLSTIYRVLDPLTTNGIINEVTLKIESQKLYEFNQNTHHHFLICESCRRIETVYGDHMQELESDLEQKHKFKIKHHNLEFYGTCEDCEDDQKK